MLANCLLTACYLFANCLLPVCQLLANCLLTATKQPKICSTQERVRSACSLICHKYFELNKNIKQANRITLINHNFTNHSRSNFFTQLSPYYPLRCVCEYDGNYIIHLFCIILPFNLPPPLIPGFSSSSPEHGWRACPCTCWAPCPLQRDGSKR